MAKMPQQIDFLFLNTTAAGPGISQKPETRAMIRKQAMQQAAVTRRVNGSHGRHNLRQYPVFVFEKCTEVEDSRAKYPDHAMDAEVEDLPQQIPCFEQQGSQNNSREPLQRAGVFNAQKKSIISTTLVSTKYERMSLQYGFNILDLSNLTTFYIGRATGQVLSADSSQLMHLLRFKHWSFFSYLPSRYEQSTCLEDATVCLVSRVREIISPPGDHWASTVVSLYLNALKSLQKALDCAKTRLQPEVLYAIEILALYEVCEVTPGP